MTLFSLALMCLTSSPGAASPTILTAEAAEELPLPVTRVRLTVDEWAAEILLEVQKAPQSKLAAMAKALEKSHLCRVSSVLPGALRLRCSSHRLQASVRAIPGGTALILRELRGLPFFDDPALTITYPPQQLGLGAACPQTSGAGRAECLLASGDRAGAKRALETSADGSPYTLLRLGDLALADGDVPGAARAFEAAGRGNTFGRLARARVCELMGCDATARDLAYESAGLLEPVRSELELRALRSKALYGRPGLAAEQLTQRLHDAHRPPVCEVWPRACVGIARMALRSDDPVSQAQGLGLFFALPDRQQHPSLVREAAWAAAGLGAHTTAASLLASLTPGVPRAEMREHLSAVEREYLAAGDAVRADIVREYAAVRLRRPLPRSSPRSQGESAAGEPPRTDDDSAGQAVDIARAVVAASRAATLTATEPSPP